MNLHWLLRQGFVLAMGIFSVTTGCAYHWGSPTRAIPGGYRQVFVPMFKNLSMEPGVESIFTNSLVQEFERAKVAHLTEPEQAEVNIEGEITSITSQGENIATSTNVAAQYTITVNAKVRIRKKSDQRVLWESAFSRVRSYVAPQVSQAVINTVNPLYNLSARRQNIEVIAKAMMAEVHDRITDNF